jgi:hypothetical protein
MRARQRAHVIARSLTIGLVAVVALTACGDDSDDTSATDAPTETATDTEVDSEANGGASTDTDTGESGTAASIDPSSMPPPAQAVVTVDGKTLMYEPPDPEDSRLFTCDLGAESITVNMQTPEGEDLLIQVVQDSGGWIGSVVAADPDNNRRYQGTRTYGSDAFAVDGQYMVFVGAFEGYVIDDPGNFEDVGEGEIAVTCP